MASIGSPLLWAGFVGFVLLMLWVDLAVAHRKPHAVTLKESLTWSAVWVGLAAAFGVGVWHFSGSELALQFATGYVIEKTLSVDNLFVLLVIMQAFAVPASQQHRVLFWGVLGALVMRAVFVIAGTALITRFHQALIGFGIVLLVMAVKLLFSKEKPDGDNAFVRLISRWVPTSKHETGAAFVVKEQGRWVATKLLLAVLAIEIADIVFAVDSVPAVFAVSSDPFIVFTSNVFAILGLRSLFFALSGVLSRFHLLRYGIAGILGFVGAKLVLVDVVKVPAAVSLAVIAVLLGLTVVASLLVRRTNPEPSPGLDIVRS